MSRFREIIVVGRTIRKTAWELISGVLVVFCLSGAPAIFAGTNPPVASARDWDLFPLETIATSNLPAAAEVESPGASPAAPTTTVSATNGSTWRQTNLPAPVEAFVKKLETARYLLKTRQTQEVESLLVPLLADGVPEPLQKSALLELATLAQEQDDLPRAQQICAQFISRWPDDARVPEILLRQGQLFRAMGLHNLALTKFYAVMTAALTLKNDRLGYYKHLVVQAQLEIAETHYRLGKFADAAEYYSRLLKLDNPEIAKSQILYKLVRCYSNTTNYDAAAACAQDYLTRYPNRPEEPEVRFCLASALKALGRDDESLQQVLILLQQQSARAADHPEDWAYWRQRAGNLIANQLYREGDYVRALDIYTSLARLDHSPQWQLPVWYQIGMTYEQLLQPQKAVEIYHQIVSRQSELGTNQPPNLASIADMARWRIGFIRWQDQAQMVNHSLAATNAGLTANAAKAVANHE